MNLKKLDNKSTMSLKEIIYILETSRNNIERIAEELLKDKKFGTITKIE